MRSSVQLRGLAVSSLPGEVESLLTNCGRVKVLELKYFWYVNLGLWESLRNVGQNLGRDVLLLPWRLATREISCNLAFLDTAFISFEFSLNYAILRGKSADWSGLELCLALSPAVSFQVHTHTVQPLVPYLAPVPFLTTPRFPPALPS